MLNIIILRILILNLFSYIILNNYLKILFNKNVFPIPSEPIKCILNLLLM